AETGHLEARDGMHVGPRPGPARHAVRERRREGAVDEDLTGRALRANPSSTRHEEPSRDQEEDPHHGCARRAPHERALRRMTAPAAVATRPMRSSSGSSVPPCGRSPSLSSPSSTYWSSATTTKLVYGERIENSFERSTTSAFTWSGSAPC